MKGQEERDMLKRICGNGPSQCPYFARARPEAVSSSLCCSLYIV
jgi:hypothetical protein